MATDPEPTAPPSRPDATPTGEPDDTALARALSARGVPPEEIARLLSRDRPTRGERPAATDEEAECSIPGPAFQPTPTVAFPEFREPSSADADEADSLLRQASLERRRGRFSEASETCRRAIERVPRDAAALELYDALAAYHRAGEADPRRRTAERKYAELLLLQDRSVAAFQGLAEPTSPHIAVLLSALCPGAGQYYNGDTLKALLYAVGALILVVTLFWTPYGFAGAGGGVSGPSVALAAVLGLLYVVSLVDANVSARAPRRRRSGWDV
jgi:tetratricopeptide (TPR) repeat protein